MLASADAIPTASPSVWERERNGAAEMEPSRAHFGGGFIGAVLMPVVPLKLESYDVATCGTANTWTVA